jgi:DNA-binding XRE family transcriptional regulator
MKGVNFLHSEPTITTEDRVKFELGQFIERKLAEQEPVLKEKGLLEPNKKLSQSQLARMVGISTVWMNNICRGEKMPSNDILESIAECLLIDANEIFRVARRLPPKLIEDMKKEFLGEYYIENLEM